MTPIELENLISNILNEIEQEDFKKEIGVVLSVGDGIVRISGLLNAFFDEVVKFKSGAIGIIKALEIHEVTAIVIGGIEGIKAGEEVYRTGEEFKISVSESMIGRVLNGYGQAIDGKEEISGTKVTVEAPAPGMKEISHVSEQIITGIRGIDWLICVGYGQRQLIVGDRFTGKSSLASDIMISMKNDPNVVCIYVLIGQRVSSSIKLMNKLNNNNVKNFVIIVANSSDEATMRYLAPFVGCSIGEYFRSIGKKAIIFFDDMNAHTIAYREISLIMKRPPGREAFPGDVFYLHSRLLERAANQKDQGKGSLTALPIVQTVDNDLAGYIVTNLISITDGQIVLDSELFNKNIKPAINIGKSVSRIGTGMQNPFLRKLCSRLKLELARYEDTLEMVKLAPEVDKQTAELIEFGSRIREVLQQQEGQVVELFQHILIVYGVINKIIPKNIKIEEFIKETANFEKNKEQICLGNEMLVKETIMEVLECLK